MVDEVAFESSDVGACRSCGAWIEWVTTSHGKKQPLDPGLSAVGNVEVRLGLAYYVRDADREAVFARQRAAGLPVGLRVSHFATCPNAKRHRK